MRISLTVALLLALAVEAHAQGAALSTNLDISVRAAGMGRSSNGVFWGGDPDSWSNPALLGYHQGVRYEYARTQLVPDLADDVFFTTKRVSIGAYGLGFSFSGKPVDKLGSVHLSYGVSEATSPTGEPLGTFEAFEDIDSWGVGLSVGRAAGAVLDATSHARPSFLRYADVAFGLNKKDVAVSLAPDLPGLPGAGNGSTSAEDRGVFFRLSPYDSFDGPGFSAAIDRVLQLAVDVGYGISTLNRGKPTIQFGGGGGPDPLVEEGRRGLAAHIAIQPRALEREFGNRRLARGLAPALSFGAAWDRNTLRFQGYDFTTGTSFPDESRIDKNGWELTLLNLFSLRHGHIKDPDGSIDGPTDGWSLGYTFDRLAGVRYDRATVPQATDPETGQRLANVHRHAWSFFFDPLRIVGSR